MRLRKYLLPVVLALLVAVIAPAAMGQLTGINLIDPQPYYNVFLVADLGITGTGGRPNRIFEANFGPAGAGAHYLYIEVENERGQELLSGNTGETDYDNIRNKPLTNYQIGRVFGSGNIKVADDAKKLQKIVLATGALPQGSFTISVQLFTSGGVPAGGPFTENITIIPPYIQPIYPVDTSVNRSSMDFKWRSNLQNLEFRLYSDPRGRNEIRSGSRLPVRNAGQRLDGGSIASLLDVGELYYWRVYGDMVTSHGTVKARGPLSMFLYLEEGMGLEELGLSDAEKAEILEELIDILKNLVNNRAAKSLRGYDLDRVLLDNSIVTIKEIMAILALIKSGDVQVNSIYFR